MKRLAYALMMIGLVGFLFGLGSCVYAQQDKTPPMYPGWDDPRGYAACERILGGISIGAVAFAVGVYLQNVARRKNNEHDAQEFPDIS